MEKSAKKIVAYYRVSTGRQGRSGLGLDGQREAVSRYVQSVGGVLLAEFTEIESGRVNSRPSLELAMRLARQRGAILCVAKLDRLARNVAFIATIMESRLDFVACDYPVANKLTLHILAAVAEHEVDMIRDRIRVALKAAKSRGQKLGSHRPGHWDGREAAREAGGKLGAIRAAEAKVARTLEDYVDLIPTIVQMRAAGSSLQLIADTMHAAGHRTTGGGRWRAITVSRILRQHSDLSTSAHIPTVLTPPSAS